MAGAPGETGPQVPEYTVAPIRYADGVVKLGAIDFTSDGFGLPWGQGRSWSNGAGYAAGGANGNGWVDTQAPRLLQADGSTDTTLVLVTSATTARYYDLVNGAYQPRFDDHSVLVYDPADGEFVLTDSSGDRLTFADFGAGRPAAQQGALVSYADPAGNVTAVTSWTAAGRPAEVLRTATDGGHTVTESYLYSYLPPGTNGGLLEGVALRRQTDGGPWDVVRQVQYTYYDGTQPYGNAGDLELAQVLDGAGNVLDMYYYRYYTPADAGSTGYVGGLKYAFGPDSYGRLAAAVGDPTAATDAQVAPYADNYFEYDAQHRATREVAQGLGCSACSGGLGTFTYSYTPSGNLAGFNSWATKTIETLPDGNQNTVYTNAYGEVMLLAHTDTTTNQTWDTFYQYDDRGQIVLVASPSAVTGYDDGYADLLHSVNGNDQYLSDNSGLIQLFDYYGSTTATETTPGGAAGYLADTKLQQGELGTAILQGSMQYFAHTGGGATVYPVASQTAYRNTDGTGAETTTDAYTWFPNSAQAQSVTVTLPVISAAENGPGTADVSTTVYDSSGRPVWTKDADGFINYVAYDQATGAVVKVIQDVDTSRTGDFTGLPAGWSTPPGGGLHLVTTYQVDALGRTTAETAPNGTTTYTVYDDVNHEVRVYPGWNSSTGTPTGPTQVTREDRAGGYTETLTMSAAPHLTDGVPDGTEPISGVQTLSRQYTNAAGQVVRQDDYFDLSGVTYSTAPYIGTQNTNYYTTLYAYDHDGRLNRTQLPTGTIERTVYDGQGRVVSTWVGTNDTPATGYWSPSNNTAPANMVEVSAFVYDNGGVGDGNLTQETDSPGGGAAPRVSQFFYDWRDRLVAGKAGVQASEDTTTHRPIIYLTYDNLDEVTQTQQYDGDGVPQPPAASLLRAQTVDSYDDQGRVYREQTFSVNPATGAVSQTALTTNDYYDHRGNLVAESAPGGLWAKDQFDGAGRQVFTFLTDGAGGTSWETATSVANDTVLEQTQEVYDGNGNPIEEIDRERFHNATGTGPLGTPTSGVGARVSYTAAYYDAGDRLTASVDVGTNGGLAWTRPGSVPAASDTDLVSLYGYSPAGWVSTVTDPRGLVTQFGHDALGRTTQTVEAYTDGTPTDDTNKTTLFSYDGDGNLVTYTAVELGGAAQTTKYVYSVSTASGSDVNSNDVVAAVQHPDPTTGQASAAQQETYTVNALGQVKTSTDRNGTTHAYGYDVLGRQTSDAVTALGAGVDGAVRRLETAYDTQGNPSLFTSYDAPSGGTIVNQVLDLFNGLGQLTAEYQSHSGPVNTGTTPAVQYAYTEMAGGQNNSRPVSLTYPNGRVLDYDYGAGLDSSISRLSSLSDSSGTLEGYLYLGLGTVVERDHPQTGVNLTYIQQPGDTQASHDGGDQYTGLDRFGRVIDQFWVNASTGQATDRFQYGYDRDGNVLYRSNLVDAAFSELYHANGAANSYDPLNQLTAFARGTLSDSNGDGVPDTVASPSHSQSWSFDALGNATGVATDGSTQTRTANQENEATTIGGATLTYDQNGNTTQDESGKGLVYDAWNHPVQVKSGSTVLVTYGYDALGRRIVENSGTPTDLYYSSGWQVLEERQGGQAKAQYFWSPAGIDTLVERDRDADGNAANGLEERLYAQQDANGDVTALVNTSGSVVERFVYDPYGQPTFVTANWVPQSGSAVGWLYLHQGGRYDPATGYYNFRHRDLSPTLGRWLQQDPLGFGAGDSDLYRDEGNNPVARVDPSGLAAEPPSLPPWLAKLGKWNWNSGSRRWELEVSEELREFTREGKLYWHPDVAHGPWGEHGDLQGLLIDGKPRKLRLSLKGEILLDKGPARWGDRVKQALKEFGIDSEVKRVPRSGCISTELLASLGASVAIAGATYEYDEYVDKGWDIGIRLLDKIQLGTNIRYMGELGQLPGPTFTIIGKDGTKIAVEII